MNTLVRIAVLGAAFASVAPLASAATLLYGNLATNGGAAYTNPPTDVNVSSTGVVALNLGATSTTLDGSSIPSLPPDTGTLGSSFQVPGASATDYSFNTAGGYGNGGIELLSITNGKDTLTYYATSEISFIPTAQGQASQGADFMGYLLDAGGTFAAPGVPISNIELDFSANTNQNNFTEDLIAPTPEPSSLLLLGSGLVGAGGMLLRRRKVTA